MDILHEESETKGRFYIEDDTGTAAEITYSKAGSDKIIIDHTQVNDKNRGEGLGKKLVDHVVEFARKQQLTVLPLCPFARSVISKDPDLQDVL
ncbi:GNAT family N-acetyltransferase [Balneola sp. MJW-20]|uniref:GNAT family N-acetyltransferase n=1 Tax=Gracilimonas aurantiaca TaxID=3234185 RepID=UPI003467B00E